MSQEKSRPDNKAVALPRGVASDSSQTPADGPVASPQSNATETYGFVCGTALVLIGVVLIRRGLFPTALFPVGAGFLGLFFYWRIAPVLVIGITASCLIRADRGELAFQAGHQIQSGAVVEMQTWILCSALLAYVLAHYRLQCLTSSIFPSERRSRKAAPGKTLLEKPRDGKSVSMGEVGMLVIALPFVTFAALLLLRVLPTNHERFEFSRTTWPTLVLLWILALFTILIHAVLSYIGLRNLTLAEARTFLQDLQWQELRRDLRRINRWRLWARLRKDP
ncbi:hypothetical protein BH10PLA2_BH10PLA2_20100 [soil metagenome]